MVMLIERIFTLLAEALWRVGGICDAELHLEYGMHAPATCPIPVSGPTKQPLSAAAPKCCPLHAEFCWIPSRKPSSSTMG